MKHVIGAIIGIAICFLGTAFVLWEFNPGVWSEGARAALVWFGLIASLAGAGIAQGMSE